MILLLGKNDLVEKYAKEILDTDMENDIVYYPDITTHRSELSQWIDTAKRENPPVITTQRLDMIDEFLHSDLDFKVILVFKTLGDITIMNLKKEEAIYMREILGLDLR